MTHQTAAVVISPTERKECRVSSYQTDEVPAGFELPRGEPGPFAPCVLLVDCSSSMGVASRTGGPPAITEVNNGLKQFAREVKADDLAKDRADVVVVAFSDPGLEVVVPPTLARDFEPPTLTAQGATPMGAGIQLGLDTIQERRREYKTKGVDAYAAMMFLITDGQPTDSWEAAAAAAKAQVEARKLNLFCIGTEDADFEILKQISAGNAPVKLKDGAFAGMFKWISDSLSKVSETQPGDKQQLDRPDDPDDGWGEIVS